MIEFKQIIGQGTRTYDGKDFFTIYDFVRAYEHFNDPEWDGEPIEPVIPGPQVPSPQPPEPPEPPEGGDEGGEEKPAKLVIRLADGKERSIQYIATTTYWGPDGRPISAQQFIERLFGDLSTLIGDEDELRRKWSDPDQREHFVAVLEERGYDADKLANMRRLIDAPDSDLFDVLAYIHFTAPPKTRTDRADMVRNDGLGGTDAEMRAFLLGILNAYEANGETELGTRKLSDFLTARYGTLADAKETLGDTGTIRQEFVNVQRDLYRQ
jgi:type I restriction enzyme R subunit